MKATDEGREELIRSFAKFAESRDDIRAAIVVGSSARTDHPADEFSDVDIAILARDPSYYLDTSEWIKNLGKPILTFLEKTATGGGRERRVLYENGQDADFSVFPSEGATSRLQGTGALTVLGRGFRILIDRDGIFKQAETVLQTKSAFQEKPLPSRAEFDQDLNDFFYHVIWTDKKLRRGEVWTAKGCCDDYLKSLLLRAVEWHTMLTGRDDVDTWHNGRFLEQWADATVLKELGNVFAYYDAKDVWRALNETMRVYHKLTVEVADKLGYNYPVEEFETTGKIISDTR